MRVLNCESCFSNEAADEVSDLPNGQKDTMMACGPGSVVLSAK